MTKHQLASVPAPDPYKRSIWTWMIQYGGACAVDMNDRTHGYFSPRSVELYYSSCLDISRAITKKALADFKLSGIDFNQSSDPASHIGYGFGGTFSDTQTEFHYLAGTLVSGSGKRYYWGTHVEEELGFSSFANVIRLIKNEPDWDEAIAYLEKRLSEKYGFEHNCNMPIHRVEKYEIGK